MIIAPLARLTLAGALLLLSSSAHAQFGGHRPRSDPRRAERARFGVAPTHDSPDAGGTIVDGESFWWIGGISASDTGETSGVPNSGVRAIIQAVDAPPAGGCFDCWTSDLLDNQHWGQIGFSTCNFAGDSMYDFTAFYQIWDVSFYPGNLLIDGETTLSTPGLHTYAMNLVEGTTWEYSVDGSPLGRYDMGSATASGYAAISTVCEEGDGITAPFVPPSISIPTAMSVFDQGAWSGALAGWVYNTSGLSGVVGTMQDNQLGNDAMIIGGTSPYFDGGTELWSGSSAGAENDAGPNRIAPPLVILTAPTAYATVSGTVDLAATVTPSGDAGLLADGGAPFSVTFVIEDVTGAYGNQWVVAAPPYTASWDTTQAPNNDVVYVTALASDAQGNATWMDTQVTVSNPTSTSSSSASSGSSGSSTSGATASGSLASTSGTSAASSSGASSSTSSASTSSTAASTSSGTSTAASASAGASTTGGSSSTGSASGATTTGGSTTHSLTSTTSTTGSSSSAHSSSGCGCSPATGSPATMLPLLLISLGRSRRSKRRVP